ncbi:MAG: hypothetical protein AAGI17_08300 [Planctomycetota bacterium]
MSHLPHENDDAQTYGLPSGGVPGGDMPTDAELDQLIDSILDGDCPQAALRDAVGRVSADPVARADLRDGARAVRVLSEQPEVPAGLADRVLEEVAIRRGFLSAVQRKGVSRGRLALAAMVIVSFAGVMVGYRVAPSLLRLKAEPAPLTALDDSVSGDAIPGVLTAAESLADDIKRSAQPFVAAIGGNGVETFALVEERTPNVPDRLPAAIEWRTADAVSPQEAALYLRDPAARFAASSSVGSLAGGVNGYSEAFAASSLVPESTEAMFGAPRFRRGVMAGDTVMRVSLPAARTASWVRVPADASADTRSESEDGGR